MIDRLSITTSDLDRAQVLHDSPNHFAAFVCDPDGNRIEALTRRPEDSA